MLTFKASLLITVAAVAAAALQPPRPPQPPPPVPPQPLVPPPQARLAAASMCDLMRLITSFLLTRFM